MAKSKTYKPKNDSDDLNPIYLFSCTKTELLVAIATGLIDPKELAIQQLSNRGLNEQGQYVGFNKQ